MICKHILFSYYVKLVRYGMCNGRASCSARTCSDRVCSTALRPITMRELGPGQPQTSTTFKFYASGGYLIDDKCLPAHRVIWRIRYQMADKGAVEIRQAACTCMNMDRRLKYRSSQTVWYGEEFARKLVLSKRTIVWDGREILALSYHRTLRNLQG